MTFMFNSGSSWQRSQVISIAVLVAIGLFGLANLWTAPQNFQNGIYIGEYSINGSSHELVIQVISNNQGIIELLPTNSSTTGSANVTSIEWHNTFTESEAKAKMFSIGCNSGGCNINALSFHTGNPNSFCLSYNGTCVATQSVQGDFVVTPISGQKFFVNTTGIGGRPSGLFEFYNATNPNWLMSAEGAVSVTAATITAGFGVGEDAIIKGANFAVNTVLGGWDFAVVTISPLTSIYELNSANGFIYFGVYTQNGTIVSNQDAQWCDDANTGDQRGHNIKPKFLNCIQHLNSTGWMFRVGGTPNVLVVNNTGNSFNTHLQGTGNATRAPFGMNTLASNPTNGIIGDYYTSTIGAFKYFNGGSWTQLAGWNIQNTFSNNNFFNGGINRAMGLASWIFNSGTMVMNMPTGNFALTLLTPNLVANSTETIAVRAQDNATAIGGTYNSTNVGQTEQMLGNNVTITPHITGKIVIHAEGTVLQSATSTGCRLDVRNFTASSDGALRPVIGTVQPTATVNQIINANGVAADKLGFMIEIEQTGARVNQKELFDIGYVSLSAGTCQLQNVRWHVNELP